MRLLAIFILLPHFHVAFARPMHGPNRPSEASLPSESTSDPQSVTVVIPDLQEDAVADLSLTDAAVIVEAAIDARTNPLPSFRCPERALEFVLRTNSSVRIPANENPQSCKELERRREVQFASQIDAALVGNPPNRGEAIPEAEKALELLAVIHQKYPKGITALPDEEEKRSLLEARTLLLDQILKTAIQNAQATPVQIKLADLWEEARNELYRHVSRTHPEERFNPAKHTVQGRTEAVENSLRRVDKILTGGHESKHSIDQLSTMAANWKILQRDDDAWWKISIGTKTEGDKVFAIKMKLLRDEATSLEFIGENDMAKSIRDLVTEYEAAYSKEKEKGIRSYKMRAATDAFFVALSAVTLGVASPAALAGRSALGLGRVAIGTQRAAAIAQRATALVRSSRLAAVARNPYGFTGLLAGGVGTVGAGTTFVEQLVNRWENGGKIKPGEVAQAFAHGAALATVIRFVPKSISTIVMEGMGFSESQRIRHLAEEGKLATALAAAALNFADLDALLKARDAQLSGGGRAERPVLRTEGLDDLRASTPRRTRRAARKVDEYAGKKPKPAAEQFVGEYKKAGGASGVETRVAELSRQAESLRIQEGEAFVSFQRSYDAYANNRSDPSLKENAQKELDRLNDVIHQHDNIAGELGWNRLMRDLAPRIENGDIEVIDVTDRATYKARRGDKTEWNQMPEDYPVFVSRVKSGKVDVIRGYDGSPGSRFGGSWTLREAQDLGLPTERNAAADTKSVVLATPDKNTHEKVLRVRLEEGTLGSAFVVGPQRPRHPFLADVEANPTWIYRESYSGNNAVYSEGHSGGAGGRTELNCLKNYQLDSGIVNNQAGRLGDEQVIREVSALHASAIRDGLSRPNARLLLDLQHRHQKLFQEAFEQSGETYRPGSNPKFAKVPDGYRDKLVRAHAEIDSSGAIQKQAVKDAKFSETDEAKYLLMVERDIKVLHEEISLLESASGFQPELLTSPNGVEGQVPLSRELAEQMIIAIKDGTMTPEQARDRLIPESGATVFRGLKLERGTIGKLGPRATLQQRFKDYAYDHWTLDLDIARRFTKGAYLTEKKTSGQLENTEHVIIEAKVNRADVDPLELDKYIRGVGVNKPEPVPSYFGEEKEIPVLKKSYADLTITAVWYRDPKKENWLKFENPQALNAYLATPSASN